MQFVPVQATGEAKAADGHAEALRMFKIAKDSANKALRDRRRHAHVAAGSERPEPGDA
jgi:hypothetical protein